MQRYARVHGAAGCARADAEGASVLNGVEAAATAQRASPRYPSLYLHSQ